MTGSGVTEEHHLAYEHQGDEAKVEVVTTTATTLTEKVKDLFREDGRLSQMVNAMDHLLEKTRGMRADGYEDPTESSSPAQIAISGHNHHGSPRKNWIVYVLLIICIIALVITIGRGMRDDERFRNLVRDNARQDAQIGRHDERLNRLDQQRRDAERNP